MKKITVFLLYLVLLGSCKMIMNNLTMEPEQYVFKLHNDSDEGLFILMDYNASPTTISNNNVQTIVRAHDWTFLPADYYLSFKKTPEDSVFIYVAFMDSLLIYFDSQHDYHLEPDEIKEEAIIARLTYINKVLFDNDNKEKDMAIVHFPPLDDSDSHIVYYNGYSSEDFK